MSRLTRQQLQPELEAWARDGLVDPARIPEILARYPAPEAGSKMLAILVGLGATSLLAGVALVIGSNWQHIGPVEKIVLFLLLLIAVGYVSIRLKQRGAHPGLWDSACTVWAVLPLLGLALVSQIFHTDGRISTLLAAWLVLILPMPLLTRSRGVFAVFLIGLFFAFIVDLRYWAPALTSVVSDSSSGWFELNCSAVVIYGLVAAGASQAWRWWDEEALVRSGEYLGVLAALSALYTIGFSTGFRSSWVVVWGFVIGLSLLVIWRGVRLGDRPNQVNVGFVMIGLVLMSIYIRLAGTMLDTALLFFSGGAVFLGIAWVLHRVRKFTLASAKPSTPLPQS